MSVSRKNKSMKKTSKSRKNIKKMKGGTLPESVNIISLKPTIIEFYNKLNALLIYTKPNDNRLLDSPYISYEEYMIKTVYPDTTSKINAINEKFVELKQPMKGIGLKSFMDTISLFEPKIILLLAIDNKVIDKEYFTPYLLFDGKTVYPMCLKFVCRLYINNLDEKKLFELIVELYSDVLKYLSSQVIDVCNIQGHPLGFIPNLLSYDSVLKLDNHQTKNNNALINTFIAWFGVMDPNEFGGIISIKTTLARYIPLLILNTPLQILNEKESLKVIRQNYGHLGNLTVGSIYKLFNPNHNK
jgi:hypothetical protein